MDGWQVPKELAIHTRLLAQRPEMAAVVHAHPPAALIAGLAGLELRAVFGAYNIPAMRLALAGVPVYDRPILITRNELADEMLAAMGGRPVCILRGHGITVAGESVERATVTAVDLGELCEVTIRLAELGSTSAIAPRDLAEMTTSARVQRHLPGSHRSRSSTPPSTETRTVAQLSHGPLKQTVGFSAGMGSICVQAWAQLEAAVDVRCRLCFATARTAENRRCTDNSSAVAENRRSSRGPRVAVSWANLLT